MPKGDTIVWHKALPHDIPQQAMWVIDGSAVDSRLHDIPQQTAALQSEEKNSGNSMEFQGTPGNSGGLSFHPSSKNTSIDNLACSLESMLEQMKSESSGVALEPTDSNECMASSSQTSSPQLAVESRCASAFSNKVLKKIVLHYLVFVATFWVRAGISKDGKMLMALNEQMMSRRRTFDSKHL